MKKISLVLIVITSFFFNGCIFDKLKKQEVRYTHVNTSSKSKKDTNKKSTKSKKVKKSKSVKSKKTSKKVYKKKVKKSKKKRYTKVKKRVTKNKKKVSKKSKSKDKKKRYTKKKKRYYEPYSLEKNELDPELLGPQTTITENPLYSKPNKI